MDLVQGQSVFLCAKLKIGGKKNKESSITAENDKIFVFPSSSSQSPYLDALLVGIEDNFVEILLCLSKLSIDRPSSGDVTGISIVLL